MAHPSMTRVNTQQIQRKMKNGENGVHKRPSPPSTPPPPAPAFEYLKMKRQQSDDEHSTTDGSPCTHNSSVKETESERSSPVSTPRSSAPPAVISRDELLYYCRRGSHTPGNRGLHTVSKNDPRLPEELSEPNVKAKETKAKTAGVKKEVGPPPGLSLMASTSSPVGAPPGLELNARQLPAPYTPATFRKEMMTIFKDLALDKDVGRAVRRVRVKKVPTDRQAAELADAVTYAVEETRGAVRRTFVAFIAGLVAAFEREKCIEGLQYFFLVGYPDLEEEVPKLSKIVDIELLPTLRSVFSDAEMSSIQV